MKLSGSTAIQEIDALVGVEGFQLVIAPCNEGYFAKLEKCQIWKVTSVRMHRNLRTLIGEPHMETIFDSEADFKEYHSALAVENVYETHRNSNEVRLSVWSVYEE